MIQQDFNIQINGQPFYCTKHMTMLDLLSYLGIDLTSNIIEYNSDILEQNKLKSVLLQENDVIEIITLVGGG
uniref:Thiamin biosynthesis protein S n=1 Tax=Helminthora furcellata TaxID=1884666 RepID=A0A1G4NRE9_9FLOR|nr:Thiamin biosynthesis protein S [Helminthora furcellata]SCW21232.1 Thiamin biosynthesis protein S [Helminthora furcellata]SCW24092.1 Thiamin biosynthesis protein S [Helminthora furcellata]